MRPAFKIEKGIPLSEKRAGFNSQNQWKYPWPKLEVGDSFFVPPRFEGEDLPTIHRRMNTIRRNAEKTLPGRRFACRVHRVEIHGEDGVRVWRVE